MQIISKNVLYHKEGHEQRINQDFHTCVVRSFCCYIDDICRYNGKNPDRRMLDGKKYNGKKQLSVISLINAEKYFQAVAFVSFKGLQKCFFRSIQVDILWSCKVNHVSSFPYNSDVRLPKQAFRKFHSRYWLQLPIEDIALQPSPIYRSL